MIRFSRAILYARTVEQKESHPGRRPGDMNAVTPHVLFDLEGGLLGAGSMEMRDFSVGRPEWMFPPLGLLQASPSVLVMLKAWSLNRIYDHVTPIWGVLGTFGIFGLTLTKQLP